MPRTFAEITTELNSLLPRDFNLNYIEANGMKRLYALVKELAEIDESEKISDILFLTIERLSNSNEIDPRFDIGTPGPLVHTLEKLPNYSEGLVESIKRFPTPSTI